MHNQIKILGSLKLLLLSFMLFFGNIAFAATDYKEVTVNSINQLEEAVKVATTPTRITLADGTYSSSISLDGNDAEVYIVAANRNQAVLQNTITLHGHNITLDGFLFNGGSTSSDTGGNVINRGDDNRITRCTWDDSKSHNWVQSLQGYRFEIDHNMFRNKTNNANIDQGPVVVVYADNTDTQAREHYIHHNHFKYITKGKDSNGYESIILWTNKSPYTLVPKGPDHNTRVEYNLFENCDGEVELISNKINGAIIKYNTIKNSAGGIVMRTGDNAQVSYNYIETKEDKRGFRISGANHNIHHNYVDGSTGDAFEILDASPDYPPVVNLDMHDNYIKDGTYNLRLGRVLPGGYAKPKGSIYDNTVVQGTASQIVSPDFENSSNGIVWSGNKYHGKLGTSISGFIQLDSEPSKPTWAVELTPSDVGPDSLHLLEQPVQLAGGSFVISPGILR